MKSILAIKSKIEYKQDKIYSYVSTYVCKYEYVYV